MLKWDYARGGRSDLPVELRPYAGEASPAARARIGGAKRQSRVLNT